MQCIATEEAAKRVKDSRDGRDHVVYLALGSNVGDRAAMLASARHALAPEFEVTAQSSIYETEPWGYRQQSPFLNQVVAGETELQPLELLAYLKRIEHSLGREPSFQYGPRRIDIDLLLYDDLQLDLPELKVPHPHLHERAFVLVPLAELAPELEHPALGKSMAALSERIGDEGVAHWQEPGRRRVSLFTAEMEIRGRRFQWGRRTYLMGILNLTPDSFSGDGLLTGDEAVSVALDLAQEMEAAGADLLDLGGESTRPGSEPVSAAQELDRVMPVLTALRRKTDLPLSIDTYKAEVAQAALEAGADLVNDVWGLRADPKMAALVAEEGVPLILMHNRMAHKNAEVAERLGGRYVGVDYADLLEDIRNELMNSVRLAHEVGIPDERLILDPGIGFGKTVEQNLELLDRTEQIRELGYPVLIGPSRKSFIGYTLDLPIEQRVEGTAAAVAIGIARGADMVRVHDLQEMARVAQMTDAIVRR